MSTCTTCGREADKYTMLVCPSKECSAKIVRCASCRENENKYICPSCGFTGP